MLCFKIKFSSLLFKLLVLTGIFLVVKSNTIAASYYVSPSGNDSNNGNQTSPWKTIQKSANMTSQGGDVVNVLSGTYEEVVTETSSGSSSNLIRFLANGEVLIRGFYLNGNYIELNGFTVTPVRPCQANWNGAIQSSGSNNLIVNNTVKDSIITGIKLTEVSNSNTISHNTIIRANVNGMAINGNNHTIENNNISDISNNINGCNWWGDTNVISFFGSGNVFRKNYIHNMFKDKQLGKPHVDAFQTHSAGGNLAATNTIVEQNHIFMGNDSTGQIEGGVTDAQGFHAFMIEGSKTDTNNWARNIIIKNNLIESRHGLNIGGGGGNVANLKIYNNVWRGDKNSTSQWPTGINISGVTGYEIFNNILVDFMYSHITVKNGATGGSTDNNIMWNSNGSVPNNEGYTLQSNDKKGVDPKFVANFTDYHLQSSSPAVNTGATISNVVNDKDDVSRPQGSAYDIGPYEYSESEVTPTFTPIPTPTSIPPTPTPTPLPIPGDLDKNNKVDINDYTSLISSFGITGENIADINKNGRVDIFDFNIVIQNFGKTQ